MPYYKIGAYLKGEKVWEMKEWSDFPDLEDWEVYEDLLDKSKLPVEVKIRRIEGTIKVGNKEMTFKDFQELLGDEERREFLTNVEDSVKLYVRDELDDHVEFEVEGKTDD